MAQAAEPYTFGRVEFDWALSVLDREQQAMQLSRAQRLSYKLYTIFSWGFVLCLVGTIIDVVIELRTGRPNPSTAFVAFAAAVAFCLLVATLLLVLNIPLIVKIVRHKRLFHRLGLSDSLDVLWKERQKTRRWMAIFEKVALGAGAFILIGGIALIAYSVVGGWGRWLGGRELSASIKGALLYVFIGFVFIMFYVVQNGKAWLDMMASRWKDVVRLKESMGALEKGAQHAGSGRIPVPVDVIEQFSRIETEQIARSRATAIGESSTAPKLSFSILSSDEVLKAKTGLDPDDRLKVEEAIDDLALQPRPRGVEKDVETDTLRHRVPGTDWEIVYVVDDAGRQLKLLSLRQSVIAGRK
jgi:hypothetical protein